MLVGLLGIAFGIAGGRYLTRRATTTSWARLALVVLLLVATGVAVFADGDIQRAVAGAGGGLAGAILTDAVRNPGSRPRGASPDHPIGAP